MSDSKKRTGSIKSEKKSTSAPQSLSAGERLKELLDKNTASEMLAELKDRDMQIGELGGKVKDVAGQIWLAGLGAYAKVEKEGSRWFDTLVKDGERLEEKTRELVDRQWSFYRDKVDDVRGKVEEVKDMATSSIDRIEKAFDERVANALARLNIPSKKDIDQLNRKIQSLQRELATLKSTAPKSSATKSSEKSTGKSTVESKTKAARTKSGTDNKKAAPKGTKAASTTGSSKSAASKTAGDKTTAAKRPAAKKKTTPA